MPVKWGKVVQGELAVTTGNPPSHTEDGAPGKSTAGSRRQETLDRALCGVRPALSNAEGCLGTAVWWARLAWPTASRHAKTRYSGGKPDCVGQAAALHMSCAARERLSNGAAVPSMWPLR